MKRTALALSLTLALLFSAVVGALLVNLGNANPLPDINPEITIENPRIGTYLANSVTLNFGVSYNWEVASVFYSLDGQEMTQLII